MHSTRNRRLYAGLLALFAIVLSFALLPSQALAKTGWVKSGNKWSYYASDTEYYANGIYQIDGKWYGFDAKGYMRTGWFEQKYNYDDGSTWSNWYYFNSGGDAAVGWKKIGGKWYYFEAYEDGQPFMYSNGSALINKKNYVFAKSGALVGSGWHKFSYNYTDVSWTTWYYTDGNGVAATGWKKIGGTWYYFGDWGDMYSNTIAQLGGKLYGFKSSGAMATGWFKYNYESYDEEDNVTKGSAWFYMGSNGAAKTGWQKVGGSWYYFGTDSSWPAMWSNGLFEIGGKLYYFKSSGAMASKSWVKIDGNWFYFEGSGAMAKKKWIGNYYVDENGVMATDTWIGIYHVDANGKWDKTKKM